MPRLLKKYKQSSSNLFILHEHGVWKYQKSIIQHCERSELRLHFETWNSVTRQVKLVDNTKIKLRRFE